MAVLNHTKKRNKRNLLTVISHTQTKQQSCSWRWSLNKSLRVDVTQCSTSSTTDGVHGNYTSIRSTITTTEFDDLFDEYSSTRSMKSEPVCHNEEFSMATIQRNHRQFWSTVMQIINRISQNTFSSTLRYNFSSDQFRSKKTLHEKRAPTADFNTSF